MGMFSRLRRRREPYRAVTEEERIARYVYLLGTLPASVIESAHAAAFKDLPPERRREMFERLRPFMAESEREAAAEDPTVLARLVRRAEEHRARRDAGEGTAAVTGGLLGTVVADRPGAYDPRDDVDVRTMLASAGVMSLVANQFLISSAVTAYYTVGAGSLQLASEPGWIGDTYDAGSGAGFDGGGLGGGFDAGGFGGFGGFDGGGFGG